MHRLRQLRARLLGREQCPGRLLPHLDRALPGGRRAHEGSHRRFAQRRHERLPAAIPRDGPHRQRLQGILRPQALQSLRRFPLHPGLPRRRHVHHAGRSRAGRRKILPRLPLLRAGVSLRMPLHPPGKARGAEVHAVLPPHHERSHHGVLRSLPHGLAPTGGPQKSQRSHPRVHEETQRAGAQAADGHRRQSVLRKSRRIGR